METLANLISFVRSAELGSFSEAARRLALTPAAVSRNVTMLERNLGVRLFHRSTRRLTLTEAGEAFRLAIAGSLDDIQAAIAGIASDSGEPAGVLKVSMAPTFGVMHLLPMLPAFLARYPRIRPEWHFENRPVDIVAEGYDAAIGGGFDLSPGVVARALAPAHIVAVASPAYMAGRVAPGDPAGLVEFEGIVMRSLQSGRIRHWMMRDAVGNESAATLREDIVVNDPAAMREVARLGLGVALLAMPDVLPELESGKLVRLVPRWYADAGAISVYYASRTLLPGKTRAFVDWVADVFKRERLAERFAGSLGS
ncbi:MULTISPECIES: LysR family transcriptional regulator [Sphingopyxis]|jgi:DNA-binding transcriptional LysR family regulator|uniref:LysR family transcriptional regulator n=1 Tax=Sphingopyxis terrae subsp. terrae NBRC 15098 TaxID=1219058 RepID=A0A142VVC0_9SPHN|nr:MULTISPECIES: LysR family transcriptional regulator [Sphingopyxis]AMU93227.1 LysR family transcriptional regulator [Sphingopyxis terrae subsp. terrae NBRC 15098]MCM3420645.1 LysR family transcriptional regulator [Sphingopyxis alaskensis]MDZ3832996.1 LysR family transcriptional regulator [Sphingopyxis sp.]PAL23305.1 LysR family transcriptional regulator [Sphingopyxis sp. GW247-27LB]BBB09384.1 LysR family transcriptional regulator [Sphingopyxis sp. EG6]